MESNVGTRLGGIFIACLIGIGIPVFLLGPVLFERVPLSAITSLALTTAIVCGLFGVWLFLMSCLASAKDVEKVLQPFQGSEAVILFLPYMLIICSKSVWHRFFPTKGTKRD